LDRLLQVAHAAVHELGAAAAGPLGEVGALDERHLEPAAGGVEGRPGPGGAATDHQHVEALIREPAQRLCPAGACLRHQRAPRFRSASPVGLSMTSVLRKPPRRAPTTPGILFSPATTQTE